MKKVDLKKAAKAGGGYTVALHGEDWCHLCQKQAPETLDAWSEHVAYTRLCYDCLHSMYYMLRRKRNQRLKQEEKEDLAEIEFKFGGGPYPEHWPSYDEVPTSSKLCHDRDDR